MSLGLFTGSCRNHGCAAHRLMVDESQPRPRCLNFARELMAEVSRLLDVMTLIRPWPERLRLCMIWLVLTLKLRLKVRRDVEFALRWQGPRTPQRAVISDVSELRVIREVFVSGEYDLPGITPKVILDLGSNIGISIL